MFDDILKEVAEQKKLQDQKTTNDPVYVEVNKIFELILTHPKTKAVFYSQELKAARKSYNVEFEVRDEYIRVTYEPDIVSRYELGVWPGLSRGEASFEISVAKRHYGPRGGYKYSEVETFEDWGDAIKRFLLISNVIDL